MVYNIHLIGLIMEWCGQRYRRLVTGKHNVYVLSCREKNRVAWYNDIVIQTKGGALKRIPAKTGCTDSDLRAINMNKCVVGPTLYLFEPIYFIRIIFKWLHWKCCHDIKWTVQMSLNDTEVKQAGSGIWEYWPLLCHKQSAIVHNINMNLL